MPVPELTLEPHFHITENNFILECVTKGLPSTATLWSRDGILLDPVHNQQMSHKLSNHKSAHYKNGIVLTHASSDGVWSCDVHSKWLLLDRTDSGRKSKY